MPVLKTLDLNLLKALDALLDERSVTRAAQRLSLTQPAVSGLLTRLRHAFDDPLFTRAQRGIVPTDRALLLAPTVKEVLATIDAMFQPAVFEPAAARMTVTLAATDYALRAVVLPFMKALRVQAPQVRVSVRLLDAATIDAKLERGEVDLALMTPDSASPHLHARRLFDETYVCALRADHPDAARRRMPIGRFCALEHVLVSLDGDPFKGATDVALAALGRSRRVALSVASFLLLPELLKGSDMIAMAPLRLVQGVDGLKLMKPPIEVPGFTKLAVWHERTQRSNGHKWLRDLLVESCRSCV